MQTQTMDDLKRVTATKIKSGKNGSFEITVKSDTPDGAVALVIKTHQMMATYKAPEDPKRADLPALILEGAEGNADGSPTFHYAIKHGAGEAAPYDPTIQEFLEDYRIKIDLVVGAKGGIGWDVTAKGGSPEESVALVSYTEQLLAAAFKQEG